jgi:hypothetical protein
LISITSLDHCDSMATHGHKLMIGCPNTRSTSQTQGENFTGSNVTHVVGLGELRDTEASVWHSHG